MADWKERLGIVYSTDTDFEYETAGEHEPETLAPERQNLRIWIDRKNRGGNVCACLSTTVGRMRASGLTTIGWA